MLGFGTALEHAGFAAAGGRRGRRSAAPRMSIFIASLRTSRAPARGGEGVRPVAHGVQGALEAELVERGAGLPGALEQDAADQVIGDGVEEECAPDHARSKAAPGGGLHGGLAVVEVDFDPRAARVETGEGFHGPEHGVEPGADEQQGLSGESRPGRPARALGAR